MRFLTKSLQKSLFFLSTVVDIFTHNPSRFLLPRLPSVSRTGLNMLENHQNLPGCYFLYMLHTVHQVNLHLSGEDTRPTSLIFYRILLIIASIQLR
jgi:hypothetical protein